MFLKLTKCLLILSLFSCHQIFAQLPGELAGHWTVDCGREYHPELSANFVCLLCFDFRKNLKEDKQFHMYFVSDSLVFPENYGKKKNAFSYKWNPKLGTLSFKYFVDEYNFKVIKAGDSYILVSEGEGKVILLLRRE